jgi:hypothetical protein
VLLGPMRFVRSAHQAQRPTSACAPRICPPSQRFDVAPMPFAQTGRAPSAPSRQLEYLAAGSRQSHSDPRRQRFYSDGEIISASDGSVPRGSRARIVGAGRGARAAGGTVRGRLVDELRRTTRNTTSARSSRLRGSAETGVPDGNHHPRCSSG